MNCTMATFGNNNDIINDNTTTSNDTSVKNNDTSYKSNDTSVRNNDNSIRNNDTRTIDRDISRSDVNCILKDVYLKNNGFCNVNNQIGNGDIMPPQESVKSLSHIQKFYNGKNILITGATGK